MVAVAEGISPPIDPEEKPNWPAPVKLELLFFCDRNGYPQMRIAHQLNMSMRDGLNVVFTAASTFVMDALSARNRWRGF